MNLEVLTLKAELNRTRLSLVESQAKLLAAAKAELLKDGEQIQADLKKAIDAQQAAEQAAQAVEAAVQKTPPAEPAKE